MVLRRHKFADNWLLLSYTSDSHVSRAHGGTRPLSVFIHREPAQVGMMLRDAGGPS